MKELKRIIQNAETGNTIDIFNTKKQAEEMLLVYEKLNIQDGIYTKDFYEIKSKIITK